MFLSFIDYWLHHKRQHHELNNINRINDYVSHINSTKWDPNQNRDAHCCAGETQHYDKTLTNNVWNARFTSNNKNALPDPSQILFCSVRLCFEKKITIYDRGGMHQ